MTTDVPVPQMAVLMGLYSTVRESTKIDIPMSRFIADMPQGIGLRKLCPVHRILSMGC